MAGRRERDRGGVGGGRADIGGAFAVADEADGQNVLNPVSFISLVLISNKKTSPNPG